MFNYSALLNCLFQGFVTGVLESISLVLFIAIPTFLVNIITKTRDKANKKDTSNLKQILKKHSDINSKTNIFVDRLPAIYFHIFIYSLFLLFYIHLILNVNETVNIEVTDSINNISNIIYTIILSTIGVIVICASLKKDYYVVFNYNDVTKKYKFLPASINLIIVLMLTIINQVVYYSIKHIVCYVYVYLLIITTIIISGYLILVTLNLLFSSTKAELTILNSLRYIYNDNKNICIENDNIIGTTTNLQYLFNQYLKALNKLHNKCNYGLDNKFIYKYSNSKKIFNKKIFCNCLKTTISTIGIVSLTFAVITSFFISIKNGINIFKFLFTFIGCLSSLILVFVFSLFLFTKIKMTKKITYNIIYGKKTHFIFCNNKKIYYYSDYSIPLYSYKAGVNWLHALKNLDAFFKIYTNTNNEQLQIRRMHKIINTYKENLDISANEQIVNPFINLPLILFFYHSYMNFEDKESVINFFKEQKIIWDKELHNLAKSIINELYKDNTKFNCFFIDMGIK